MCCILVVAVVPRYVACRRCNTPCTSQQTTLCTSLASCGTSVCAHQSTVVELGAGQETHSPWAEFSLQSLMDGVEISSSSAAGSRSHPSVLQVLGTANSHRQLYNSHWPLYNSHRPLYLDWLSHCAGFHFGSDCCAAQWGCWSAAKFPQGFKQLQT